MNGQWNGHWSEVRVKELLQTYGIPVPRGGLARTKEEAAAIAARIGFPVVVKAVSPHLLHKSEAGAVQVGIWDAAALETAYARVTAGARQALAGAEIEGVLVEAMAGGGVETFAAVKVDPIYGPLVGFGLGGIYVEVYRDLAWWPAPLTPDQALELVRSIRGFQLLNGYRGRPRADLPALTGALVRLSRLAQQLGSSVAELEINPLAVLPEGQGVLALDGVLIGRQESDAH